MLARQNPEQLLATAVNALSTGPECRSVVDELPVPVYATDETGALTYWNRACAEFAGREPQAAEDRWCVTWPLYSTTGEPMPREDCPMAQALREQRPIRDLVAIAERPDGSRLAFKSYPTPLFNQDGSLKGAVNMLIDVTDEQSEALHEQAERCRRLAQSTYDRETSKTLDEMASGFDSTAKKLRADNDP